ncbi:hypothetical protein BGX21_006709 [Mortierella sp. AD011]|nr:hypothetical protein BGX21_006709 [Mortierella sp. AD011]
MSSLLFVVLSSLGHATQWGEVKGKKKTQKPKTTTSSQRGGFADRGSRGRGDGFRGGRGGSTRGTSRQAGDRQGRSTKVDDPYPALNGSTYVEKIDISTSNALSWANITAAAHASSGSSSAWGASSSAANETSDSWSTPQEVTTFDETVAESEITTTVATDSWDTPEPSTVVGDSNDTSTTSTAAATDSWGSTSTTPARKLNTSTIPAGSKMSWAKIVKPEPAPQPVPQPAPVAPSKSIPATTLTPAPAQEHTPAPPVEEKPAEVIPEPIVETVPEPTPVVEEASVEEVPEPEIVEPAPEKQDEETVSEHASEPEPEPEPEPVPEPVKAPAPTPTANVATNATPVGPPGLKHKHAPQPRRLNQDAAVVMPIGSTALQSVALKFGSFSLNDEPEPEPESEPAETEPETQTEQTSHEPASNSPPVQPEQPVQPAQPTQPAQTAQPTQTAQPAQPAQVAQPAQPTQSTPPAQQQQDTFGRPTSANSGASGYQAAPAAASQTNAGANASYPKQDPAVNYLGQHHHHPGMGHDAMSNPYGSYMPAANQLGNFGMGPIASLPNDYAALYGNDIQRAMYYDPNSYGQMPITGANSYQTRDNKYTHDSSAAVSTTGAASAAATQAQQTLQQQQQQQAYPNMAGGMPYYPYYYMQHQFPNAYQQSGYGQPFMGKNMYPMYQQQHSNKPGSANNSPYSNYGAAGAGQGSHHQYSQAGYDDMSGAGLHGMGGLGNDPYAKYNSPGMQSFLGGQQQVATPTTNAGNGKTNVGSNSYGGAEKTTGAGSQSSNVAGGASLQGQQGVGVNQMQQAYYQQQMFSNYQYPNHHQGYHPSQHQGQHQGSGRNNNNSNQQFWSQN